MRQPISPAKPELRDLSRFSRESAQRHKDSEILDSNTVIVQRIPGQGIRLEVKPQQGKSGGSDARWS